MAQPWKLESHELQTMTVTSSLENDVFRTEICDVVFESPLNVEGKTFSFYT